MKTIRVLSMIAALALISLAACDDDPAKPVGGDGPIFKNLTQREDVLNNLQLSYNRRNLQRYVQLLDNDLTFFLAPEDVGGGLPAQWDRAVEVTVHTNLFDPDYSGTGPACQGILLDIVFEDGVMWAESDPPTIPAEKWYTTTLLYKFKFDMEGDFHLINGPGSKAQFTVRNAGTAEEPQWRLVEMRDLGNAGLVASSPTATEQSTWGSVKALYR